MLKKIWKFLSSMRFAIILLLLVTLACALGSFIPQGQETEWYFETYSPRLAALIVGTGMDDLYHSWWLLGLTGFLCANLLLCNLLRLPQLLRRYRLAGTPAQRRSAPVTASASGLASPDPVFAGLHMPKPIETTAEGRPLRYAAKNRAGLWGAWVCHLGILLLIVGFTLGQMSHREYTVVGVPGQNLPVEGTDYALGIDDFQVLLREDDTVEQYLAQVTLYDLSDPAHVTGGQAEISVNHPADLGGFRIYQNTVGRAARLTIAKDGQVLQDQICCLGDQISLLRTPVSLTLQSYVPDYDRAEDGSPVAGYAYAVYINDEFYTMDVQPEGGSIGYLAPYEASYSEPQYYTIIQLKRDRFSGIALAGGLLTMLGLFLAFYLQPKQVWALQAEDGTWTVTGSCPKGGALFRDRFEELVKEESPC